MLGRATATARARKRNESSAWQRASEGKKGRIAKADCLLGWLHAAVQLTQPRLVA
jgi:hypothetical protein